MNVHIIEFLQLITHYLECFFYYYYYCMSISAMIILFEQMSDINILLCISEEKLKNELAKQQQNAGITCVLKCNQDELYILRNATINFL